MSTVEPERKAWPCDNPLAVSLIGFLLCDREITKKGVSEREITDQSPLAWQALEQLATLEERGIVASKLIPVPPTGGAERKSFERRYWLVDGVQVLLSYKNGTS